MSGRREGAKRPHGMTGEEENDVSCQLHGMTKTLQRRKEEEGKKTRKEGKRGWREGFILHAPFLEALTSGERPAKSSV